MDFEYLHFPSREGWREWLKTNHSLYNGLWLVFYKGEIARQRMDYDASVEEALCFGWIDSTIKKLDDEKYARKFTPRTNTTNWSDLNIKRAVKLIEEGKMDEIGHKKIGIDLKYAHKKIISKEKDPKPQTKKDLEIPVYITDFFKKHEPALTNFNKMSSSHKRYFVLWITNARREETITKRLEESVNLLKENKKLGLK